MPLAAVHRDNAHAAAPSGAGGGHVIRGLDDSFYQLCFDEAMDVGVGGLGLTPIVAEPPKKPPPTTLAIKVVLVGDHGVGKSAIAARFCDDFFRDVHATTVGVDPKTRLLSLSDGSARVKLELFDTPGIEKFRSVASNYYQNAHAVVLVYDVNEPKSFANLETHLHELKYFIPPDAEIVLMGTKCDVAKSESRVSFAEADSFAARMGLSLFEVSALTGHNIEDGFTELAEKMTEKLLLGGPYEGPPSESESEEPIFGPRTLQPSQNGFGCSWLCA